MFSTLTDSEVMRVTHHSALTEDYYKTICGLNQMRLGGNSLGAQLQSLKNALLAGGAHRAGSEDDAAIAAIDGAVKFVNYWQAIPSDQQEDYFNQYPRYSMGHHGYRPSTGVVYRAAGLGLKQIIRRFIRPTASDASECVEVTASYIDTFLWRYRESIHNDTGNIEEACNAKKTQFETAIKQDDYQVSLPRTNIPDNILKQTLLGMLSESTELQQTFFESIASLLSYAAEKRPSILLDLTADRSTGDEKKYITACSKYITRLTNVLHKYPDDILAKEKRDIVLHATLALLTSNILTADERINQFKDILLAGKDKLATRRDHPLVTFAKALGVLGATVFGIFPGYFAYQHFFGKKATEGHKLLNEATAEKKQEADPGAEINRPFD